MGTTAAGRASFAGRLRALREGAGLSQEELAERAGLSSHAVSALERGTRTRPYPHTVRALADALGATGDDRAGLIAAVPARGRADRSETAATTAASDPRTGELHDHHPHADRHGRGAIGPALAGPRLGRGRHRRRRGRLALRAAYSYALLDTDETVLLGGVRIQPSSVPGRDAEVGWWPVAECRGTDLARAVDRLVPAWVADRVAGGRSGTRLGRVLASELALSP